MKITDVEAIIVKQKEIELIGDGSQDTVVIKVHTDEGITGIGEVDSSPYVVKAIVEAGTSHMVCMGLRDIVVGEDPFDVEKIWYKMYNLANYYGRRSVAIHAMSGIDMAIWDILGKKLGDVGQTRILGCAHVALGLIEHHVDVLIIFNNSAHIGNRLLLGVYMARDVFLGNTVNGNKTALGSRRAFAPRGYAHIR